MASTPIPPSLEELEGHVFAFYPAVLNEEHNEWRLVKTTWSEILVANVRSEGEIWIPRRYISGFSRTEHPILIVGLNRELQVKGGMVVPYQSRVLSMPGATGATPATSTTAPGHEEPKPIKGLRLDPSDRTILKLIGGAVLAGVIIYFLLVNTTRVGDFHQRVTFTGADQSFAGLGSHDDYVTVVEKLGQAGTEHQQEIGTIFYRSLNYPDRKYTVILMGSDRNTLLYIGTVDDEWRPIHSVNEHTASLLRALKRF